MLTRRSRFPVREILLFGFLPSFLKVWVYRLRGYRMGRKVRLGLGTVICGSDVEVGDGVSIGFCTILRGRRIRLGRYVDIGSFSFLDTPHLELGEGTKINEQVFVGGLQFPDSKLVMGRNCQVMQMTFINPTCSILIGDDTGIGGDCLIFGHSSWLSKFEGYPVDFRSIEIGNSVSLAWRVFVIPGARIGDGVVVGANSLVNRSIPPRCLAVGFPAKVVAREPYFPRKVSDAEKRTILSEIVAEMQSFWTGSELENRREGGLITVQRRTRRWFWTVEQDWHLWVEDQEVTLEAVGRMPEALHVVLSLRSLSPEVRRHCESRNVVWIDLETKERSDRGNDLAEEVALYLRRYGVRLNRSRT